MYLARNDFWGKTFAISLLDLPFSISPVITGARQLGVPAGRLGPSCKGGAWQRGGQLCSHAASGSVCWHGEPRAVTLSLASHDPLFCRARPLTAGARLVLLLHAHLGRPSCCGSCLAIPPRQPPPSPPPPAHHPIPTLPFAGMMFVLLYGRKGLFAPLIAKFGFPIVFAFPGEAHAATRMPHIDRGCPRPGQPASVTSLDSFCQPLWPSRRHLPCLLGLAVLCALQCWARGRGCHASASLQGQRCRPAARLPVGMALATLFVTMPFVVRELLPILEQMDMAEEEAAR